MAKMDKTSDTRTIQEYLFLAGNPESPDSRTIWHARLQEDINESVSSMTIRASARMLARKVTIFERQQYFLEPGNSLDRELNSIELLVDLTGVKPATLAPNHDIIVHPKGIGVGRVLMSLVIRRAKELFPEQRIARATLGIDDARTDNSRDMRNGFYEKHNFVCSFLDDPERRCGYVSAPRIGDLVERINCEKVSFLTPEEVFLSYVREFTDCATLATKAESLQKQVDAAHRFWSKRLRIERHFWGTVVFVLALISWFRFW